MCLFTHFAAGALAGGMTGNIWTGLIAGVASHAVLDAIPHYDHPDWRVELGGGLLALVALALMPFASWPAIIGGLFGMIPDLENLFQKLGKIRRDQFIFPSHTGLIPHGRTLKPRSIVWQFAIFVVCFGLLGLFSPVESIAKQSFGADSDTPVMGSPQVELLSETIDRSVFRVDFPVEKFVGNWSSVDPMRVNYALAYSSEDLRLENPKQLPPLLIISLAVPTLGRVQARIIEQSWWLEPGQPVAQQDIVSFARPTVFRSVPLSVALIPLTVGGGVLRSLTVEVIHPVSKHMEKALDGVTGAGSSLETSRWRELPPSGLINTDLFARLSQGGRIESLAMAESIVPEKASVPDLFSLSDNWAKMMVTDSGVFSVTGQDLLLAGVSASSVHPGSLRLYRGGGLPLLADPTIADSLQVERVGLNEVAIRVAGAEDGELNLDDEIWFYGFGSSAWLDRLDPEALPLEHFDHPFAAEATYWLTWESTIVSPLPGIAARIEDETLASVGSAEPLDVCRTRLHFEDQNIPVMGLVSDNWVWDNSISTSRREYFQLPEVVTTLPARFVIDFRGNTDDYSRSWETIAADAWAGEDPAGAVSSSFSVSDQGDSNRVRLAGWFAPNASLNSVTLLKSPSGTSKRDLSLDSFDVSFYTRLDLAARSDQLEFAHWQDQVLGPGYQIDLEILGPANFPVQLWDVTEPDSPRSFLGVQSSDSYIFGLTREQGTDRHFVALTEDRLLKVDQIRLADPVPLRLSSVDVDYLVVHPEEFSNPARSLADFRSISLPDTDSPVALAVDVQDIYDNFSGGQKDWRAIRNYFRHVYENGGHRLRYVCLLGNACRDYRNYKGRTPLVDLYYDFVPTEVRTPFPSNPTINWRWSPYASDDGLVSFEKAVVGLDFPDLACGRLPAVSLAEAEQMVQRAIDYDAQTASGSWRNSILMVADDLARPNPFRDPTSGEHAHTYHADWLVENRFPTSLDATKIFATEYDFPPGGISKPEVRADINIALSEGTTVYHYVGHGSQDSLADERIFESSDVGNLTNGMKRPVFVAFSCDVGVYESTTRRSMAEQFLASSAGGAIASICASQVSYTDENNLLSSAFYRQLFPDRHIDLTLGLGRSLQLSKSLMGTTNSQWNSQRYNLLGDPACVLPHPVDDVTFSIDSIDTLEAGVLHSVVIDSANEKVEFQPGDQYDLRVQESAHDAQYDWIAPYQFPDSILTYVKQGASVFRGTGTVGDGDLVVDFMVPAQVRYGDQGRIRLILNTADGAHVAEMSAPTVRSTSGTGNDKAGPSINLSFEDGLRMVRPGASLTANISDPSGVAILGTSPGNSILLEFDDTGFMTDITESFQYDPGSYTSGRIDLILPNDMTLGDHQVSLHASDAIGNVGSDTLSFEIGDIIVGGMDSVALFPNPTSGPCRLVFELGEAMDLQWDIYTLAGRRLRSISRFYDSAGPFSLAWDGLDEQNDQIANGTYIYVLRGSPVEVDRRQLTRTGKLVIMR